MATKIGGDQLRLDDFIKNPTPNGDWSSSLLTATQAAIKALVDGSGSIQYVGGGRTPTYINELAVGIYFVVENGMLYYNRDNYFSITQEGLLIVDGSNPYNDVGRGYHVICGNGEVHNGLAARSRTYSSHNIGYLNVMIGAADGWAGKSGNVPQPMAGDNHKFLRGNGTWGEPDVFDGATALAAGQKGIVPAPQAGDNLKFLRGDATWQYGTIITEAYASALSPDNYYDYDIFIRSYPLTQALLKQIIVNGGEVLVKCRPGNGDEVDRIFRGDIDDNGAYLKNLSIVSNKLRISEYRMQLDSNNQERWVYSKTEITI